MSLLNHGGKLATIAAKYGRPVSDWIDLSTGISPVSYPVPPIPEHIFRELPQVDNDLLEAAKVYYNAPQLLATSGSQATIQTLPSYWLASGKNTATVWLPEQGYKEHEKAWRDKGFNIIHYHGLPSFQNVKSNDIVVVINPNNPTGRLYCVEALTALQKKLSNGWLIIDEAFMDSVESPQSMLHFTNDKNLFVLRSLGKFFGLAGIRIGFVAAHPDHLENLNALMGPWHVSSPAQFIAKVALADNNWQIQQRLRLKSLAEQLTAILIEHFEVEPKGTNLFKTVYLEGAPDVFRTLCENGVYVRLTDELDALRFGIPTQEQLIKLAAVLKHIAD